MGLYDRDYGRGDGGRADGGWDTGSGWRDGGNQGGRGGGGSWTNNSKLLLAMVVAYFAQVTFEPWFTDLFSLQANWFAQPWRVFDLLTYGFLHSTQNIQHLLFNGIALFFFGRAVESRYGSREYLAFFCVAVVGAGLIWSLSETFSGNGVHASLVGASGGIAAVLILFALNYPHQKVLIWGVLPVPAWLLAVLFLGQDLLGAFQRVGNVAYTAHLGGALFGYLYFRNRWRVSDWLPSGWLKMLSFKSGPKLKIHAEQPEIEDSTDDRLDEILEKIQRSGKESLSRDEQRYLEKASRRYQKRRR